ncbi:replication-associated protein [Giant panda associated gemycircularvirus]|nr:replication-associated protein [Giant panda associated gemycircularvirus]
MPSFFCNARYFLVTYPQCGDLCGFRVMERFSSLGAECIVARESHEDGGLHLHCFADFGRKFRSRKTDVFDVDGHHPNIEPSTGTPEKGYDYAIKDGDVVAGGLERPVGTSGTGTRSTFDKWTEITSAPDRESFWELCHQLDPKSTACSYGQLAKYADWRFAEVPAEYESPMSLVLYGESRTGKTLWARSLGPHVYNVGLVSGEECLKAPHVKYAIFDDIRGGIKFFPAFKEWLGGQQTVCVKRLYRDPKLVTWGKPSIWISNDDPRQSMDPSDVSWMEMNCVFIEVNVPIFRALWLE